MDAISKTFPGFPTKTVWTATVKTPGCDGHHHRDFDSEDAAFAYGFGPESAGIIDVSQRVVIDWAEQDRRMAEYHRIERTTCPLPPPSDLLLVRRAKDTAPADYATIDPEAGIWHETRERLRRIRNDKRNEARNNP